jgi:hypothetical protein
LPGRRGVGVKPYLRIGVKPVYVSFFAHQTPL